jgi:hypothetical protein
MDFANLTTASEQLYVGGIIPSPDLEIPDIYTRFLETDDLYTAEERIDITFPVLMSTMAVDF